MMIYTVRQTPQRVIQIKTLSFSKEIHKINQDVPIVWLINQDFKNKNKKGGWNNINPKLSIYRPL